MRSASRQAVTQIFWVVARATALALLSLASAMPSLAQVMNLGSNEKAIEQTIAQKLLRDIYRDAGLTLIIESLPGARANALVLRGEKDGEVARVKPYSEKNPTLIRIEPAYYHLATGIFAKVGSPVVVKERADLAKYRIGYVRGIAHAEAAVAGLTNVEVLDSYEQMYRMVDAGRLDAAVDTSINGLWFIRQLGLANVQLISEIAKFELFNILHPRHENLAPRIAAAIRARKASGELDKLILRYENEALSVAPVTR